MIRQNEGSKCLVERKLMPFFCKALALSREREFFIFKIMEIGVCFCGNLLYICTVLVKKHNYEPRII